MKSAYRLYIEEKAVLNELYKLGLISHVDMIVAVHTAYTLYYTNRVASL